MAIKDRGADHSLTTQIKMYMDVEFQEAANDIEDVSERVRQLTEPVEALKGALNQLNDAPLGKIVKSLNEMNLEGANITSAQLRVALEEKIKESIMKSKISMVGEDGNKRNIEIKMGEEFWERNKEQIQKSIGDSLSNIVIEKGDIPPLDVTEIMREFGASFNQNIAELVKQQGTFDLFTEKEGLKVPRFKTPFKMSKKALDGIMEGIGESFSDFLSDGDNIIVNDIPPLNITSDELGNIVDKISASIGNIDEHMGIDPKVLEDLPNISVQLKSFSDKLVSTVTDINAMSQELSSISIGEITEGDIKKTITSITKLKKTVIVNLDKWASKLANELTKNIKTDTDLSTLTESMTGINKFLDELVQTKLKELQANIERMTVESTDADIAKINEIPSMIAYQITNVVLDKFTEMGAMDLGVDTGEMEGALLHYGKKFQSEVTDNLIEVISTITEGVSGTDFTEADELNAQIATNLKNSYAEFTTKLTSTVNDALKIIDTLTSSSEVDISNIDITKLPDLTKNQMVDIDSDLAKNYEHYKLEGLNIRKTVENFFEKSIADTTSYLERSVAQGSFNDGIPAEYEQMKSFLEKKISDSKESLEKLAGYNLEAANEMSQGLYKDVGDMSIQMDDVVDKIRISMQDTIEASVHTLNVQIDNIFNEAKYNISELNLRQTEGEKIGKKLEEVINSTLVTLERQVGYVMEDALKGIENINIDASKYSDIGSAIKDQIEEALGGLKDLEGLKIDMDSSGEEFVGKIQDTVEGIATHIRHAILVPFDLAHSKIFDGGQATEIADNHYSYFRQMIAATTDSLLTEIEKSMTMLMGTIKTTDLSSGLGESTSERIKDMTREINSILTESVGDIKIPKSHVTSLVRTYNRMSKNLVDKLGTEVDTMEFSGVRPIKVNIGKILKKIEGEIKEHLNSIELAPSEGTTYSVDISKLDININKLIQKSLNLKATAIGKIKPVVGEEINDIYLLQKNIGEYIKKAIDGYDVALKESVNKKFSAKGMGYIFDKVIKVFNRAFYQYGEQMAKSFEAMDLSDVSMSTRGLDTETRKRLADKLGVSVSDLLREMPELDGVDYGREVMTTNVRVITDAVNKYIGESIKTLMQFYKESIKDAEIEPDVELTGYVLTEIRKFQDAIIKKTKEMVRDQFRFLTEEINAMNIDAKSLGYKPTQAFDRAAARANPNLMTSEGITVAELKEVIKSANKESTVKVDKMSLSGTTIDAEGLTKVDTDQLKANIKNNLITEAPNVVVNGRTIDLKTQDFNLDKFALPLENYLEKMPFTDEMAHILPQLNKLTTQDFMKGSQYSNPYNPLNANNIAFPQQQAPSKGGMTKIFENMARYFFVGYAMQMPIKAITSATKVSSELDYRVAKSKQNILIKDPTMENTARSVVYERYQSEGKDVGTEDFQADVQRESAKLRNMMGNEMNGYLINVAKAYYQDIGEVGKYYEIASRRSSDPYDALNKTKEIAKIAAAEMDMDTEFAAIGLEALAVQWGIQAEELDKYTNMMLKTAMLSSTTVTDLLSTQRDTGQMFKSRLTGMDDERSYATAMALSSMFTESTGKSGREGGTFWKNILNRPYVKDSRKYLEAAAQHPEFEGLDPYYTDKDGNRRQKDFLTMLTGIMEASLKVDDPSKMAMYSELFPIRTISGAESLTAITDTMKKNFEETVKIMRETGELGPDATIDNVNVKDVIEAYVDKIIDTDDEDIAGYIAGLQDTYKFGVQGLTTQWESTVYKIFMEFKEESSLAMTYLTHILRQFEDSSSSLSEVIKIFAKIGTGLLGEKLIKSGYAKLTAAPTKPSEFQKKMAADHNLLRVAEHAKQVEVSAIESITRPMVNKIETLQADREVVKGKMAGWQGYVDNFGEADTTEKQVLFNKAQVELEMLTTEYSNLGEAIKTTEEMMSPYIDTLNDATKAHGRIMSLGDFLDDGMGSRRPQDLKANLGNMYRNDYAYNEIAKFSLRNQPDFSDEWYAGVQARKDELEEMMRQQQKSAIEFYTTKYPKMAEKDLTNLLGEDFGDPMYGFGHRLTEQSTSIMDGIARSIAVDTTDTGEFKKIFHDMKLDFENTRTELEGVNKEIIKMNVDKAKVETIIFEAERPVEGPAGMISKTPRDIMGMYRDLMPTAGVDVTQFESGMDKLTSMFTEGKIDVDMYEDSLREVSTQLGISDQDFLQFKEIIRQINAEVQLGKTSIMEYITALQTANKIGHLPSVNKVTDVVDNLQNSTKPGTGVNPDLLGTAVGGSALLAATQGLDKSNNLSKIGGALTKLSSTVKGGKIATAAGDLVSKGSTALKALPGIGMKMAALYAITDIAGKGFGGMAESTMSEGDRKSNQSDRLDETINKFVGRGLTKEDSDYAYLFKGFVSGGANLWDAIGNQFSNALGGTAPTWSESMAIERMVIENPNMDRAELVALIKNEFDVEALRREGSILKQLEHLSNNPMNDKDGSPMDFTDPKGDQLPLEELMDFIGRELGLLNEKLGASDSQYTNEKLRLLISGSTENSKEMRKAIKEHLDRNISELETMIESFKVYLEQLAPGTENYKAMQLHIMDMENKKLESELGLIENTFSELNEITTEAGKRGTNIQARYDIKRYDALLSGIKDDSHAIRQIENKMAEAQIQSIETTKTSLTKLLDEFKNDPHRRDQILAQMLQLDVEKRRLLYDIKEKLPGTISTFNLPSEIKPITYYEAMARKGTAKNMSVRAGDTIVNVNIDNMSGSDADIDRMGRAVSNAVNSVQKNYVRQFANDVKSGMGNNYYSWNQY